ncbi:tRNA A64-2'-O-ribosylphosphate transferase-like isoform X1 [Pistacia vera]|uniref:tRNA A64-2'-O-ribosylphosphate transferase-like isoform X1 n=2 Tax=Pistacia vera TaxID=55513 RepID=UPI001263621B|nr:tRNA A64-2'-O-ribosylphosphate transferase-like isoform X1 [Pistacia vera]
MENEAKLSIYRAARSIKRRRNSLYNALRSIYEDSVFVGEISHLWPQIPLLVNLRCGLWYSPNFHSTCYFKSTDGHTNNWSFNTSRLNLHVALLAGQKEGCMIVDSTRKGKRFPDSMSKTIPIWTCVLNRSVYNYRYRMCSNGLLMEGQESNASEANGDNTRQVPVDWDCSLHLPLWVSDMEKAAVNDRLDEWVKELDASGADIASLASCLKKPLRPLWISQKSVIWLNEVPDHDSWDFTPIILVSASSPSGVIQQRSTSEYSWNYIPGAGDDEESWARGLSPNLFWNHVYDLINSGPDVCNQKVADIVEKDRVYRAQRGQIAPQVTAKHPKLLGNSTDLSDVNASICSDLSNFKIDLKSSDEGYAISWLGSTNLAVGTSQNVAKVCTVDCILNCDQESITVCLPDADAYMHLPVVNSKLDRFSLLRNLPSAVNFAKLNIGKGNRLLICCHSGEDISVCICLAILISLFNGEGLFDNGKSFSETPITKLEMRRRLIFICKFATNARPSRGNLKQVFNFLSGGRMDSI